LDVMTESTLWWLLAGSAVVIELLTGTFYLLMLSLGLAAGALAAHFGASLSVQLMVAAVVGSGAVLGWHLKRKTSDSESAPGSNRNVNLDIGETVQVDAWSPDGSASVKYRGSQWRAVHRAGSVPSAGTHRIVQVNGNELVLEKRRH
jgi:membrane protein implicated in regulation of membrane protease activity